MLDINKIRENRQEIETSLLKRMSAEKLDLDSILKLDDERRELIKKIDDMKASRNNGSKSKPTPEIIEQMKKLGDEIRDVENELSEIEKSFTEKMSDLPNIVADDVTAGGKENNEVATTFGEKPEFDFETKNHVELATSLKLIDYERAVKMSGSGFWAYTGLGAELEWALINYFIDFHRNNKYTFLIPPFLLSEESAYTSGHLPKFRDDLFWTQDKTCLNATSEMMLGNYHRGEILNTKELPLKYYAYSTCFRREAGGYRTEERGMIRGHQFNKVEMFMLTKPEDSWAAFDELLENAKSLVEGLGLHYQVSKLAAGDCSSAMAKTCDLEVWLPSMNCYKEVSSVSNALDYQSRRGKIRYRNDETNKTEFVHTLNGSGLATSRLIPAILEQFQQADGSIIIPEVLHKYMAGVKKINPIV